MPLLAQEYTTSGLSDFTQADLRHYVGQLIAQVKSEPHMNFDAYKLGGNIAYYQRERPNSPIRDYHKSLGDDPQRVVDDLKSRFHDLLVTEGVIQGSLKTKPSSTGSKTSGGSYSGSSGTTTVGSSGESSANKPGSSSAESSDTSSAGGQTNQVQKKTDSESLLSGNSKTYLYVGGAVAGGVLLLILLNN